jgi:hypothetical protein
LDASANLWLREYLFPHRLRLLRRGLPQLIPATRPGLAVARWRVKSRANELRLEIFQEALVESGLLEAIVLSIVLIRSGRSLGDSPGLIDLSDPRCFASFHPRIM